MAAVCILIVEDESLLRWALRTRLAHAGYRVLEAGTGREALEQLREEVHLVLLDLNLPDAHGLALLKIIKERKPGCRVILMTARSSAEAGREAIMSGADLFVEKPLDLGEMARMVSKLLTSEQAV